MKAMAETKGLSGIVSFCSSTFVSKTRFLKYVFFEIETKNAFFFVVKK